MSDVDKPSTINLSTSIEPTISSLSENIDSTNTSSSKTRFSTSLKPNDRNSRDFDSIINEYKQTSRTASDNDSWSSVIITYLRAKEDSDGYINSNDHSSLSEYSQIVPYAQSYKFRNDGESSKNELSQHSSCVRFTSSQVEFVDSTESITIKQHAICNKYNVLTHYRKAKVKEMIRISRKRTEKWKYNHDSRQNKHKSFEELDIIEEYEPGKEKRFG
ncbi:uncharacterized protein VICG_01861 [Vittaforma corneae ATCC 50505]|uniref:Uncharacterized protein n=1 Tax=Vittaforma corneae (strain ATCC 50505) TaxID=993615 RepID=L2GJM1_VITCO|nr:uncharacterized protein VICG_01861 [Vittaforma corneae ATCC 50505]ELA41068.1 hypothetical protein VICG_01861 [Vittaforma corneae ATCC 50505]